MKFVFLFAAVFIGIKVFSKDIAIVRDGKPLATIVLDTKPTRAAQFAAFELAHVIKLITKAELPITRDAASVRGIPIYIGGHGDFAPEEYMVLVQPEKIILSGNDGADFGKVDYQNWKTFPQNKYALKGTTYAVYDFLEKFCDVRFVFYGDNGIAMRERPTLSVRSCNYKFIPAMSTRQFNFSRDPAANVTKRDLALLDLRWRKNVLNGEVNHNTWSIYFRYWAQATGSFYGAKLNGLFIEKHPEYFAQGYKNKSQICAVHSKFPGDKNLPPQLCPSHPFPTEYFANEAYEVFSGKFVPGARIQPPRIKGVDYYYPILEDDNKYWCKCAKCREMFKNISPKLRHGYIHFDWINRIARTAKKLDPQIGIITCAYSDSLFYPDPGILKLEPNIAVRLCLAIDSWYHPGLYKWQHKIYKEWVKNEAKKRPLSLWLYMLCPGFEAKKYYRYVDFFPVLYPWKAAQYFEEFVNDGIQGYYSEVDSSSQWLEAYVGNRIAFEGKNADTDKIINDYFTMCYGAAGENMKQFYREMENISCNPANYPPKVMTNFRKSSFAGGVIHTEQVNFGLASARRLNLLQKFIDDAKSKELTAPERSRLEWFISHVWAPAVRGKKNFDKRERLRNVPPPAARAGKNRKAFGIPAKADFSDTEPILLEYLLDGSQDKKDAPKIFLVSDGEYLYVKYSEKGGTAYNNRRLSVWKNGIEFFMGYRQNYPLRQIAIAADGSMQVIQREIEGGVPRISPISVSGVKIENICDEKGWHFTFAFPLSEILPDKKIEPGKRFLMNVFRSCRFEGGKSRSWSISNGKGSYVQNLERMGKVYIPE